MDTTPKTEPDFPEGTLGIIVVAYNDARLLERCLAAVRAGTLRDFAFIVVDNSTRPEVSREIASWPGIHYLKTPENLGFCGANNLGMRKAIDLGARWLLLLNHDAVPEAHCLGLLVRAAADAPRPSLATGKIRFPEGDKRLWYAGGYFSRWIGAGKNYGFNAVDAGQFDRPGSVSYATGCCLLIPAEIFRSIGGLYEPIFMYLDDIEYCLRARAAGFDILYEPRAIIGHDLGSGSDVRKRPDYYLYFSIRNKPLVVRGKPYTAWLYVAMTIVAAVKFAQFLLLPGIAERPAKLRAIAWGWLDGWRGGERYRARFPRLFGADPG